MGFSKIDICNKAIGYLGLKPIASLTENTQQAIRLKYVYDTVRDGVLRDYAWPFATTIESLNQVNNEKVAGWLYLYLYPPKCLHLNKIFQDTTSTDPIGLEYKMVISPTTKQKTLALNYSPAYIEYVFQVDDPSFYDADFVEALAMKLASETSFVLTGNMELGPKLNALYSANLTETMRSAGQEKKKNDNRSSTFEDARS